MSDNLKIQLISATNTFLATFVVTAGVALQGGVEWTAVFWLSVATSAGRAAVKAVLNLFLPVKLGGRRK